MSALLRNNVTVSGRGQRAMVLAHGYGCDQNMWRLIAPAFADDYRLILFDHVGSGRSDASAYDRAKYSSLQGYADDVLEICDALDVQGGVFVGHSVSSMIGALAAVKEPHRFDELVLIGPSPRYIDDEGYVGGFKAEDITQLLEFQESNYLGWSSFLAEKVIGDSEQPALVNELANSFCQMDPEIAKQFAAVTFLSDNRADLPHVGARTLIIQCKEDVIAPPPVAEYVHRSMPRSELAVLDAVGHAPHLSAPDMTIEAMKGFLGQRDSRSKTGHD
jgi:sigma-B regulation protein RsbQ